MAKFVCENCRCLDNPGLCFYWVSEKKLCTECDPRIGVWHGAFRKRKWDGKEEVLNPLT